MTEEGLENFTEISSTVETSAVNSFIRRSISNKDDSTITPLSTSWTGDTFTQTVMNTSTDDEVDREESDNDSFDDEEEITGVDSLFSSISYGRMICPICLESTILQSVLCCKFSCCQSCWHAYISSTINDGQIKISCASDKCDQYLTRETIVNFIRQDSILHDRYLKLYTNANQHLRAKTCPRCSHLYSLDDQTTMKLQNSKISNKKLPKQVQCSECCLVWCFRCAAPWHENLTCKQFLKGDKLLSKWINQKNEDQWNARKCPKCSSVFQRAGGCPHMTCPSCSCEFCYLCGRRYTKIPFIGQHSNKFSVLGCPFNLHPEKPWLRRTIRGAIATSVVAASPLIVVAAVTAAVTVLPSVGIYRLVRHVRNRRYARASARQLITGPLGILDPDEEQNHDLFGFDLHGEGLDDEILRILRQFQHNDEIPTTEEDFPLAIFADMDVENLFVEEEKSTSDFRTCPTTPAINDREVHLTTEAQ